MSLPEFGGTLMTILAFIVALSVIVVVHEMGHYLVGRWTGIRAEVFSVGFGPRLASWRDRRGTLWQIAAIPLGGYVRFLGDSNAASAGPGVEVAADQRAATLEGAPLWARFLTVSAGPASNFVFSTLVFAAFLLVQGLPVDTVTVGTMGALPPGTSSELQPGDEVLAIGGQRVDGWADMARVAEAVAAAPQQRWTVRRDGQTLDLSGPDPAPALVGGIAPGGAAASAGVRPGDVLQAIDGTPILRFDEVRPKIEAADGQPVTLSLWREGTGQLDVTLTPKMQDVPVADGGFEQRWLIGVTGGGTPFAPAMRRAGPVEALSLGVGQTWGVITASLGGLAATITGQVSSCSVGGAISIAESTAQAASVGLGQFVWWIAVLSAAIGLLNLLPIPVLDGGHLAFYLWEAVTGRPPAPAVMSVLTTIGLVLVLGLMLFGLSNDLFCP